MSARLSTVFPRACSAMYPAVPRIIPTCVAPWSTGLAGSPDTGPEACATAANPVEHLDYPRRRDHDVRGLQSRCTMPFSCAASSASAICRA
jgi:hypothetical protein